MGRISYTHRKITQTFQTTMKFVLIAVILSVLVFASEASPLADAEALVSTFANCMQTSFAGQPHMMKRNSELLNFIPHATHGTASFCAHTTFHSTTHKSTYCNL